jgi:hypothetical protein
MALQLIKLHAHPNELAVTKIGAVITDGAFFLDFSRPLERIRWLGVRNRWIGFTIGLLVPVVHQGEHTGGYVIGVTPTDPYFGDLQALWKTHYPLKRTPPSGAKQHRAPVNAGVRCQPPWDMTFRRRPIGG